jgi:hypothetical protein
MNIKYMPPSISHGSSVGIAMGYGSDGWGSIPGTDKKAFSSPQRPDLLWGQPSLLYNRYRELFLWEYSGTDVKLTDHSPPSNVEVKNGGATPQIPHISSWRGAKLIRPMDN